MSLKTQPSPRRKSKGSALRSMSSPGSPVASLRRGSSGLGGESAPLLASFSKFVINYRDAKEYLQGNPLWLQYIKTSLLTSGFESSYDVFVKAHGGGLSGQAQAISLGIARALLKLSENHRAPLRKEGLLTRDSRVVERKKAGLKKARKAPQFSKR